MNWHGVQRDELDAWWPRVELEIHRAVKRQGDTTAVFIRTKLEEGTNQLWVVEERGVIEAVIITTILTYPLRKVCAIKLVTGNERFRWQEGLSIIEAWARGEGCSRMRNEARPGWRPFLEAHGYRISHVVMERDL